MTVQRAIQSLMSNFSMYYEIFEITSFEKASQAQCDNEKSSYNLIQCEAEQVKPKNVTIVWF